MSGMTHVAALIDAWRGEVTELTNRYAAQALANLTTQHIDELEKALKQDFDEPFTLKQASHVSGFSDDYLGRLIRQGKLTNVGRKNAPRVRRGDLPSKIGASEVLILRESSTSLTVPSTRTQIAQAAIARM